MAESENIRNMTTENLQQAREAMANYLRFWEQMLSHTPWGKTELAKKLAEYAQQNITNSFDIAQRLAQAKDVQDILQIQTDFFQSQMNTLNEQAKNITATVTDAAKAGTRSKPD